MEGGRGTLQDSYYSSERSARVEFGYRTRRHFVLPATHLGTGAPQIVRHRDFDEAKRLAVGHSNFELPIADMQLNDLVMAAPQTERMPTLFPERHSGAVQSGLLPSSKP